MMRRRHAGLLALNGALLGVLALVTLAPGASAQREARRARGEYTMVAGKVQGLTAAAIYIVDSNNAELLAVRWDQSRKTLAPMGFRDLSMDAKAAPGGGR